MSKREEMLFLNLFALCSAQAQAIMPCRPIVTHTRKVSVVFTKSLEGERTAEPTPD